ncbi:helix-turn-helix transcriptional regulator [Bradyrhizobium sp. WSM1253]|uniref:helix-turn-helix domain-containing protein n=1 Tax=Bradyrhizobium sp. WSM1253 TaxID=319003 RepID=UPI00025D179C|nr:helix-turn-helix transcriptional regulator [Bradyrhizobium sp. WSM1253]EIG58037.1 Helix-turn-helix protein [Bradyrhizobium sp. WSM1253]
MSEMDGGPDPVITRVQIKAARALMGWSQADLAEKAAVATSTLADFERGHRSPVPDNLDAIRSALEAAGISFPPGGAVAGPIQPVRSHSNVQADKLRPVRWITETDLDHWADRRDGQAMLPELVRRLILAEKGYFPELRFPSGDSVQMHGWDGQCKVETATDQLPAGWSGWELGTDRGPKKKADKDYKQRAKDALDLNPTETTFVFVTPRRWAKKEEWVQERRAEKHWRDVRAYDAVDLVQWIERFPAVGLWLARLIEKAPEGVRELCDVWREWSLSTKPPLSADLIVVDREDEGTKLLNWLYAEPSAISVQAEAPGEAFAFLYAAIEQLPEGNRDFYHTRAIVAGDANAARSLADVATPLIIVLDEPDAGLAMHLVEKGHYVFLAFGSNIGAPSEALILKRPTRYAIENELEKMGLAQHDAKNFAHDSGRSLTILRRLIPAAPSHRVPEWATPEAARALMPALLAGAWDEGQEGDRAIIEDLAGTSYEKVAAALTPLLSIADSPLRKAGNSWKIASPRDAWFRIARNITLADLDRFAKAANVVLTSVDPRFSMAPDERWMAGVKGKRPEYSGLLQTGISETLVLLNVFGKQVTAVPHADARGAVIVRDLLRDADAVRWWSLSNQLQVLAEASPEQFLGAVEDSLNTNSKPILELFVEGGGPMGGSAYHANLLWALETLAWSRDYLAPATALLARLTALDPGGRWGNRPARSLREVFVLWCPQTNAPLQDRLKVLNRLRKIEPEVSWSLLLGLYPRPHDTVDPAPVPRWRDFTEEEPEPITDALYFSGARQIGDWLLEDVGITSARWVQLIEGFDAWPPDLREAAVKRLLASESKITDDNDRANIQRALRALISHHRQFEESDWSLPENELDQLEAAYTALAPFDKLKKIEWLFENEQAPLLNPSSAYDWERNIEASNEARRGAISSLMIGGVEDLFSFAQLVKEAGLIGRAVAQVADSATVDKALARGIDAGDDKSWNLAHGIIVTLNFSQGNAWGDRLIDRAVGDGWGDEAILRILLSLPKSEHFMQKASSLGEEVDRLYWARLSSHWIQGTQEAIASAIEKLLAVGRGRDCIHLAGHHLKGLPSSLLVRILDGALQQAANSNDHNEPSMFQYHVERIFQCLDESGVVSESEMARLEWSYLNVLQRSKRPPITLRKALSTTPQLFVQVLSVIYRPRKAGDHEEVQESEPVSEEQKKREAAIAGHAYRLLNDWHEIPGRSGNKVDGAVLEAWVKDARILAADAERSEAADQHIGRLFAYSPAENDGTWPCTAVRELIEVVRSRSVERGFYLGVVNKRGATWRRPTDGSVQERELAKNYRKGAKELRLEWPRTASVLEQLSQHYLRDGVDSDDDADRSQW